jgi:hypothetical protein
MSRVNVICRLLTDESLAKAIVPKMQRAILGGLFNLSSPVEVTCVIGNCQWPEYSTMPVNNSCKKVSSNTQDVCNISYGYGICNYTAPSGLVVEASNVTS